MSREENSLMVLCLLFPITIDYRLTNTHQGESQICFHSNSLFGGAFLFSLLFEVKEPNILLVPNT